MKTPKEKQIVINVSQQAKDEIKLIKEQYDLTDKDFVNVLLDMFKNTTDEEVKELLVAYAGKKKQMQLDEQLARYTRKIQMLREAMVVEPTTEQEEVLYSSEQEEEEVNA